MAKTTPTDRFDEIPDDLTRVGAHRAPARQGRGWIGFAWAALATGVLVLAGVVALAALTDSINLDLPFTASGAPTDDAPATDQSEEPEATETAAPIEPLLDPSVSITVLNGTSTAGLAGAAGDKLVAEGWCGAAGPDTVAEGPCADSTAVGSRANASSTEIAATAVYYGDPANESAALALVASLGIGEAQLSEDFPESPITVLLGSDYLQIAG
ncbi:LytR C-terminal domain-containing protein [Marisediminicola antarctica]|uniref:LytR/CpsA/Psr regulator C-terminal domain-containing protein n=1 Tax=Marisediminicola antarctica TaxID=674079 RepID=A0A7L5AFE7_9MICO|nr:LytR C-terminal domain-containing protein [Marisediminicola antarctica]QHO69190.1 hypothetical protein BHD05_05530 [Marisediminicola antarctica]